VGGDELLIATDEKGAEFQFYVVVRQQSCHVFTRQKLLEDSVQVFVQLKLKSIELVVVVDRITSPFSHSISHNDHKKTRLSTSRDEQVQGAAGPTQCRLKSHDDGIIT
jgi:hypothetical protein